LTDANKPRSLEPAQFPSNGDVSRMAKRAMAQVCADNRSHRPSGAAEAVLGPAVPAALAYALCDRDEMSAKLLVDDLLAAGLSVEDLCLNHLAPAARRLGELWDRDRLPFTEVTIATARIQSMLRRMPHCAATAKVSSVNGAFFAAVPGEEHTLGVMMAADLFRRSGWDVSVAVGQSHDELIARLGRDDRPVIGLSCSGNHSFAALARLMADLRRVRPDARLLLSGQVVFQPERLEDLPQPFTVIRDSSEGTLVMQELEAELAQAAMARAAVVRADSV
jgi:methanogenic corrinoid protein MtbC1